MFVYLIRDGETPVYKIGITHNLANRLKQLNGNQSPNEKHIVFYIEVIDAEPIEAILHNKYKKYNHRREWFRLNNKQVENVIQDMDFMKNNEQILYSNNHEEEDNDDEMSDRVLELLAHIESLDLGVIDILELINRLTAIAIEKRNTELAEQEEEPDDDDEDDYFVAPSDDEDDYFIPASDDEDDFVVADD
ncbi:GIY-YIG nuclease family protein [Anabaena sp. UHCC 0204]|nr:GIY-YIG nuclease family protein [Anabaena sp. UHCC 0204]